MTCQFEWQVFDVALGVNLALNKLETYRHEHIYIYIHTSIYTYLQAHVLMHARRCA